MSRLYKAPWQTTSAGDLVLPKTSGVGIKVDEDSPTFGYHDLRGHLMPKTSGAGTPTFQAFRGNVWGWSFVANDVVDFIYHLPHDYEPGSDIYFHVHWAHNGTAINGNAVFTYYATYAKGHNQANYPAEVTGTITYATVDIATTPQYRHRIDEIQISAASPSGAQLDTDDLEIDGVIKLHLVLTTLPTITAGSLYIDEADIHYKSTGVGTKNKSPNFYS